MQCDMMEDMMDDMMDCASEEECEMDGAMMCAAPMMMASAQPVAAQAEEDDMEARLAELMGDFSPQSK